MGAVNKAGGNDNLLDFICYNDFLEPVDVPEDRVAQDILVLFGRIVINKPDWLVVQHIFFNYGVQHGFTAVACPVDKRPVTLANPGQLPFLVICIKVKKKIICTNGCLLRYSILLIHSKA